MTNKSPTLAQVEIALILGEVYGFAVFPVQPSGPNVKQPYSGFKWKEHSSADPIRIKAMWTSYPDGVPAIDCGKSDLIVVDADCKDGRTGVIEWELLDLIHTLPDTPIVETPSGGQHIWFRQRQGCERIGCGRGSLHK